MIQFNAHFDGKNLCPEEPISLQENVTLRVQVAAQLNPDQTVPATNLDIFASLERDAGLIDGPTDWSAEHDHYMYGVPKHGNGTGE